VVAARDARAGTGSFTLGRTTIRETNSAWRVMISITLPKPPRTARPTFKFSFLQQTVFEGSGGTARPVKHPMRVVHEAEINFSDGSTIWKEAKADLSITRQEGFQPGEYKLTVKGPYGDVGQPVVVTLVSDNP
jgi:hypothetical protein